MTHDQSYPEAERLRRVLTDKEIGKSIGAFLGMSGITSDDVARIRELVGYGVPAQGSPEPDAWQWRYVGDRYWKIRSGGLKLTPSDMKNERPIEQRPLYAVAFTSPEVK